MKRIYTTLFALLLTLFDSSLYAQDSLSWDDFIDDYATDENEESTLSDTYETLTELHEHPLNINTATREELGQLPFLTDKQIEEIQAYIHSYGEMKTAGELLMIESLDYETRQKLMHFIYIGEVNKQQFPSIENILKYGKQEILASASIPFYNRNLCQCLFVCLLTLKMRWNLSLKVFMGKNHGPIYEIPKDCNKFTVISRLKILPGKIVIFCFRCICT